MDRVERAAESSDFGFIHAIRRAFPSPFLSRHPDQKSEQEKESKSMMPGSIEIGPSMSGL